MKYTNTKVAISSSSFKEVTKALRKQGLNGSIIREERSCPSKKPTMYLFLYGKNGGTAITWGDDKLSFDLHEHREISYKEILGINKEDYEIF